MNRGLRSETFGRNHVYHNRSRRHGPAHLHENLSFVDSSQLTELLRWYINLSVGSPDLLIVHEDSDHLLTVVTHGNFDSWKLRIVELRVVLVLAEITALQSAQSFSSSV